MRRLRRLCRQQRLHDLLQDSAWPEQVVPPHQSRSRRVRSGNSRAVLSFCSGCSVDLYRRPVLVVVVTCSSGSAIGGRIRRGSRRVTRCTSPRGWSAWQAGNPPLFAQDRVQKHQLSQTIRKQPPVKAMGNRLRNKRVVRPQTTLKLGAINVRTLHTRLRRLRWKVWIR